MINGLENRILRRERIATSQKVKNSYKGDNNIVLNCSLCPYEVVIILVFPYKIIEIRRNFVIMETVKTEAEGNLDGLWEFP